MFDTFVDLLQISYIDLYSAQHYLYRAQATAKVRTSGKIIGERSR